jgi:integrase
MKKFLVPAFGSVGANALRRADVAALLFDVRDGTKGRKPRFQLTDATKKRKPAGAMANRVRAVLGSFYCWATAEEQRQLYGTETNPISGLERVYVEPEPQPRVYAPAELRAIFGAAADVAELRHLIPLVAFTLTRSNEARGARWGEFDLERNLWTIPAERSKDRRPHLVPLSEGALGVLDALDPKARVVPLRRNKEGFLFPAPTKTRYMDQPQDSIASVRTKSGVKDLNLHPLRDTAAHWLIEELAVRGDLVEDLLSHTPSRLERAYRGDRRSSLADMRSALDLWSSKLAALLTGQAQPTGSRSGEETSVEREVLVGTQAFMP